jgi:DNA-binding transcriptional LysR family regulator
MKQSPLELFTGVLPFVVTAELRSFRGAARQLGVSAPAVSKAVSKLEAELGVRLLQRSSRSVTLTSEGEIFLARCRTAVGEVQTARELVSRSQREPRGLVRLSLPDTLGDQIVAALGSLLLAHPGLEVQATITNRFVQLIEEHVDVVVRLGGLTDSSYVGRRLRTVRLATAASPTYLKRCGIPKKPEDVLEHNCLGFVLDSGRARKWTFRRARKTMELGVAGNLTSDHGALLLSAALAGLGLIQAPHIMIARELEQGTLIEVLRKHAAPGPPLAVLCAPGLQHTAKVRAVMTLIVELLGA